MIGQTTEHDTRTGNLTELDPDHKVYLPQNGDQPDGPKGLPFPFSLPKGPNFFDKYPRRWTWESWAKRMEFEALTVARYLDAIIWGTVGALIGLGLAGIPGAFLDIYDFGIWQPLGAAVGAAAGALLSFFRWKEIFTAHDDLI